MKKRPIQKNLKDFLSYELTEKGQKAIKGGEVVQSAQGKPKVK